MSDTRNPTRSTAPHSGELPFESIEGAQEFLGLLVETIEEAQSAIGQDAAAAAEAQNSERRLEAFRLVTYKLNQLHGHVTSSRRLLNDLRTLRRLLLRERASASRATAG